MVHLKMYASTNSWQPMNYKYIHCRLYNCIQFSGKWWEFFLQSSCTVVRQQVNKDKKYTAIFRAKFQHSYLACCFSLRQSIDTSGLEKVTLVELGQVSLKTGAKIGMQKFPFFFVFIFSIPRHIVKNCKKFPNLISIIIRIWVRLN